MAEMFLLDTNVVADFFNNLKESEDFISNLKPQQLAISVVTYTEALVGFDFPYQEQGFNAFIERLKYFSIERTTARIAAELKKKYRWKLPDAYQAALAVEHNMTLVTRNTKDFDPKVHSFVKIPYRVR